MSRRIIALALCLTLVALAAAGCDRIPERAAQVVYITVTPTAAPTAAASAEADTEDAQTVSVEGVEPAAVYKQVGTTRREIALVLEGFTNEETMTELFALLKSRNVRGVFFLTGANAADAPQMTKDVIASGLELGNYGLNEKKELHKNSVDKNYRQLTRAQELLTAAAGVAPRFLRCNGSTLTGDLLRVATLAGLQGVVEPTA